MYDVIIIGSGFAGAVTARELAEKGKKVLVLEKREHIGGNVYDEPDEHDVLIHRYGPHIFHTNNETVYQYLSRFTEWYPYSHEVVGAVYGQLLPVPFNLNTLHMVYGEEKGGQLEEMLIAEYGEGARVPILKLRENDNEDIRKIAEYVYENIFLHYTMKQWGKKPEEVDPAVSGRVPVLLSRDNRYFQDTYQGMPLKGYTALFEKLLNHENIEVQLNTDGKERIVLKPEEEEKVWFDNAPYHGQLVYTGPIDELFDYCYGKLPYRSLEFEFEYYEQDAYQSHGVVNYTVSEAYTRITEFKKLTGQDITGTTIVKEYPKAYSGAEGEIPYYAILEPENRALYEKYVAMAEKIPGFYLLGRLAEYQYYNMDGIVEKALELVEQM